jgi:hypothetical protein
MSKKNDPASKLNHILIRPTRVEDAEQMETLTAAVYGLNPRECADCLTADHFRQQVRVFPEGQFVAVDTTTDHIVGLTASMRLDYDLRRPITQTWWEMIGYG